MPDASPPVVSDGPADVTTPSGWYHTAGTPAHYFPAGSAAALCGCPRSAHPIRWRMDRSARSGRRRAYLSRTAPTCRSCRNLHMKMWAATLPEELRVAAPARGVLIALPPSHSEEPDMIATTTKPVAVTDDPEADLAPAVPAGWRLLPAGVRRRVQVWADVLHTPGIRAFSVTEAGEDRDRADAVFAVKILGPSTFHHTTRARGDGCREGSAWVETEAAVLVRVA